MGGVTDAGARWQRARRVLAVRLDNLGDVLMTTPALRALRAAVPGRHVTLLASGSGAAAAAHVPEIDDVVTAATPWMPGREPTPQTTQALVGQLRAGRYDAAVIFTVYSQSALPAALVCWLAGIPLRLAHSRENPYHLLSDWLPDPEPHELLRHEARRQLDLVAAVGATTGDEHLSFRVPPADLAAARVKLRAAGVDAQRRFVVVHPGASAASRRYPEELFAAAARHLLDARADAGPPQLVFTGDPGEVAAVERIRALVGRPVASLAGQLGLGELAAVLGDAALLVANNTGPVHVAAALGTPVVDIYALTNPQHAPWQVPHRVLYEDVPCRFCYKSACPQGHHHCLRLLDPARVAAAAHELLELGAERSSVPLPAIPAGECHAA